VYLCVRAGSLISLVLLRLEVNKHYYYYDYYYYRRAGLKCHDRDWIFCVVITEDFNVMVNSDHSASSQLLQLTGCPCCYIRLALTLRTFRN